MTDTIKISRDELQRIAQGCACEVTTDALFACAILRGARDE